MLHFGLFLAQSTCKWVLGALYDPSQSAMETAEDPNVDLRKLIYNTVLWNASTPWRRMCNTSREKYRRPQVHVLAHLRAEIASLILNPTSSRRRWKKERSWSRSFHKHCRRATRSRYRSRGSHLPRQMRATSQSPCGKDRQPKNWADRMSEDEQEEMDSAKR